MLSYSAAVLLFLLLVGSAAADGNDVPKRILKRRELAEKNRNTQSVTDDFSLDMRCDGLLSAECLNYMQNYVRDYINVDRKYSRDNIPVKLPYNKLDPPTEGDSYDTMEAEMLVTFHDLISVDTVSGSITLSIFMDLYWEDQLLSWNSSNTQGNAELILPVGMIWNPDFVVYNAIGGSNMEKATLFLYADGSVNYSGKGVVTVACTFDLLHFPFDTQTCSAGKHS